MECFEFETVLHQRLDERLVPCCPELDRHAETCPACRLLMADAELLSLGVATWRANAPAVSADLTSRVTEHLLSLSAVRSVEPVTLIVTRTRRVTDSVGPSRTWQSWAVLAASAAAIWLVFFGSVNHQPGNRTDPRVAVKAPLQPQQSRADLGAVLVSAEGAYSHLANESLAVAQDFALLWPASRSATTTQPPAPGPAGSESPWNPAWPSELAPISDSVEDAWNFLRRTMPDVSKTRT